jgi:hypothetical protein
MRRLFILGTILVGLLVAFSLAGEGGLQTAKRAEATEITTTVLSPTSGGITAGSGPSQGNNFVTAPCNNCYITQIVPDLVYQNDPDHADGTTANFNNNNTLDGAWLHHLVVLNACNLSQRIFASGNERTTWTAPATYGYNQTCASGWYVNYHIHNNGTNTRHVALKLVVTYRTGETLIPLTPFWWDMGTIAKASEYQVDEGFTDSHTGPGQSGAPYYINDDSTSTVQGRIISIGGHVHDYGISVSAYNNRLGDYVCTSIAGYNTGSRYLQSGGPGTPGHPAGATAIPLPLNQNYHEPNSPPDDRYHIQQMSTCSPNATQSIICVGDVIRLHTQYNNTSLFPILDAMGIIAGDIDTTTPLPDADHDGITDACDPDIDGDGVANGSDNCPRWPNASQAYPLVGQQPTAGDADCDGFPDPSAVFGKTTETNIGTNPLLLCAADTTANNEPTPDANPMDFNDDRVFNGADTGKFGGPFGAGNHTVAQGPFGPPGNQLPGARFDLNGDGVINSGDTGKYQFYNNKVCTP